MPDGFPADTGAGFVGIRGMNLAIGMDMFVNINVGTATGAGVPGLLMLSIRLADIAACLDAFKATSY